MYLKIALQKLRELLQRGKHRRWKSTNQGKKHVKM
jgi:hypothetical protein